MKTSSILVSFFKTQIKLVFWLPLKCADGRERGRERGRRGEEWRERKRERSQPSEERTTSFGTGLDLADCLLEQLAALASACTLPSML